MKDLIHRKHWLYVMGTISVRKKIKNNLSNAVSVKGTYYALVIFKIYDNTDFCKILR